MAKPKRDSKGRFLKKKATRKKARKNPPKRSTKKGGRRKTARRAYMKSAPKRRSRRNPPSNKQLTSVVLWASLTALGKGYVSKMLGQATGSPQVANYGTIAAIGALGYWLTRKAKTEPAGYAVLGLAFGQLAGEIGSATGLVESGAGFLPKSQVMKRLPKRVYIPAKNPVGRIVVPA